MTHTIAKSWNEVARQDLRPSSGRRRTETALLTWEQEQALSRRAHGSGSVTARNILVERNLGLVRHIAAEVARSVRVPFDELVADGNVALIRAAERFDPDRGVRFAAYAARWIRHAMRDTCCESGRALRVPARVIRQLHAIERAAQTLSHELGREPTAREIADATGLTVANVTALRERQGLLARGTSSDPAPGDGPALEATSPGSAEARTSDAAGDEAASSLQGLVRELPAEQREAISLCYGLSGDPPMSPAAAAANLGVDERTLSNLLRSGLTQLRRRLARFSLQVRLA